MPKSQSRSSRKPRTSVYQVPISVVFDGTVDIEADSLEEAQKRALRSIHFTRVNGCVHTNKGLEAHRQVKDWELPREGKLCLKVTYPFASDVDAK